MLESTMLELQKSKGKKKIIKTKKRKNPRFLYINLSIAFPLHRMGLGLVNI
jgi:hypothetical protein